VIGIDDEDDSTFTITVDQKTFHFQGNVFPHEILIKTQYYVVNRIFMTYYHTTNGIDPYKIHGLGLLNCGKRYFLNCCIFLYACFTIEKKHGYKPNSLCLLTYLQSWHLPLFKIKKACFTIV
jgi:hypothetical protein